MDIVQVLVSNQKELEVNHTFCGHLNLSSLFHHKAYFWHGGDFFTILLIFLCKHALWKEEQNMIITKKYEIHVFTTSL